MDVVLDWTADREAIAADARHVATLWPRRPFHNNNGMQAPTAIALAHWLRRFDPRIVMEIGVWRGFGLWFIEQMSPQAELYGFDPILSVPQLFTLQGAPTYRPTKARLSAQEISCTNLRIPPETRNKVLMILDDHQNKPARLMQAWSMGFKHIIFDDDRVEEKCDHITLARLLSTGGLPEEIRDRIRRYERFPLVFPQPGVSYGTWEPVLDLADDPALVSLVADGPSYSWPSYVELVH